MSVLAVIPARLGATRLPRKPLRLLGGVPLVVRVFQRVTALAVADRCIVATDDAEVIAVCEQYNVPAALTDASHPSGTDRVAQVAREQSGRRPSVILNVQGDEPFVARDAVVGAVDIVRLGIADIGTAAVSAGLEVLQRPDVVKVVCSDEGRALYFSRAPIPFLRDAHDAPVQVGLVRQHIGVYAYAPDALEKWVSLKPHPLELCERLEQLRPLANGLSIGVATAASAEGGIDTESDLTLANERWSALTPQTVSLPA
jgi:3-deoxy-manno-octulosonate cytidylyltransferase (CMP-KDO synthetase)